MRRGLGCWLLVALAGLWLGSTVAQAHEFRPARLTLQEHADGEVLVDFRPPPVTAEGPTSAALRPVAPSHCTERSPSRWSCGPAGLAGSIAMAGLATDPVDVLVEVRWSDGTRLHDRLAPDRPQLSLARGAVVEDLVAAGTTYFALGGEHILGGVDHLLFLAALLLLGGRARDHLRTISAFTVGHALTLVVQTLHPLAVPGPWVEACITASIVVAAAEALRPAQARARAWSWALGFGLLHGLGFAGALAQLGLPAQHRVTALVSFNLGVEAGQLAVVLVLAALAAVIPRTPHLRRRLRRALAFGVGSIAVAWTLERIVGFWSLV